MHTPTAQMSRTRRYLRAKTLVVLWMLFSV